MSKRTEVPGPLALRDYLRERGLSTSEAGKKIRVKNKEFRRWTSDPTSSNYEPIPWASWHMLRLLLNETTMEEVRELSGDTE